MKPSDMIRPVEVGGGDDFFHPLHVVVHRAADDLTEDRGARWSKTKQSWHELSSATGDRRDDD